MCSLEMQTRDIQKKHVEAESYSVKSKKPRNNLPSSSYTPAREQ